MYAVKDFGTRIETTNVNKNREKKGLVNYNNK